MSAMTALFIPVVVGKGLLKGQRGDYLLSLAEISDDDMQVSIDTLLASGIAKGTTRIYCYSIEQMVMVARQISNAVPQFDIRAQLPWQRTGQAIDGWPEQRARDLGVLLRDKQGYEPLPPDTVMPLIEKSLTLIDTTPREALVTVAHATRRYIDATEYNSSRASPTWRELLERYGHALGAIAPPPEMKLGNASGAINCRAVFAWLRRLLYLTRGACANVILLTSGLRNSDVVRLQVGSCRRSGRVDMLYYLRAKIKKTNNVVILPVPEQAMNAVLLLEQIKQTDSPYLFDAAKHASGHTDFGDDQTGANDTGETNERIVGDTLNRMIRDFAEHFAIPFTSATTAEPFTAHCYRTTVAGWLGSASNLSVLLVRRLFGHSNDLMPSAYLRNNPSFIAAREEERVRVAEDTAHQMALAAKQKRLAGNKGNQLIRGYEQHKSRLEAEPLQSHSLTDSQIMTSFADLLKERLLNDSLCGFMTPFSVMCMRNPADTRPPPCAKRAHHKLNQEIDAMVLDHLSAVAPEHCVGGSCPEAMIGPWSESLKESLLFYADLLQHKHGDQFSEEHFMEDAREFIKQYAAPICKVFHIKVLPDGSVSQAGAVA